MKDHVDVYPMHEDPDDMLSVLREMAEGVLTGLPVNEPGTPELAMEFANKFLAFDVRMTRSGAPVPTQWGWANA